MGKFAYQIHSVFARLGLAREFAPPSFGDLHTEFPRGSSDATPRSVPLGVADVLDLQEPSYRVSHVLGVSQGFLSFRGERERRVGQTVFLSRAQRGGLCGSASGALRRCRLRAVLRCRLLRRWHVIPPERSLFAIRHKVPPEDSLCLEEFVTCLSAYCTGGKLSEARTRLAVR
jgi:hypothetical protein